MSTKAALKAAKSAIDAKKWDEAIDQANIVLEKDARNYFAKLFLGRAYDAQGKTDEAAKAYTDATQIKPDDAQAWLGLRGLYEHLGSAKVDENTVVGLKLAELFMNIDDLHRSQTAIDKLVDHARAHGSKLQYAAALATQLPTSPIYSYLEGRLPAAYKTYVRIADIHEALEAQKVHDQIAERRLRLGATLEGTTAAVKNEVFATSPLEALYRDIIDWTGDDELRRGYEERLLQRAYDTLLVLPKGEKEGKRGEVMKLAHDMVVIGHPYLLAWRVEMEWRSGLDVEVC